MQTQWQWKRLGQTQKQIQRQPQMKRQRIRQIQKNPKVKTGSGIYSKTIKKRLWQRQKQTLGMSQAGQLMKGQKQNQDKDIKHVCSEVLVQDLCRKQVGQDLGQAWDEEDVGQSVAISNFLQTFVLTRLSSSGGSPPICGIKHFQSLSRSHAFNFDFSLHFHFFQSSVAAHLTVNPPRPSSANSVKVLNHKVLGFLQIILVNAFVDLLATKFRCCC